jgi:hypothetical protein
MSPQLSGIQWRVLEVLAPIEPHWTLSGGAALVGFHLGHRTTRDLDLFWIGRSSLGELRREVAARLRGAGFEVAELRGGESFACLQVQAAGEMVLVDLVAEPVGSVEQPESHCLGSTTIQVDAEHEILVNKLCALLHRSEVRDLFDIEALVAKGGDLSRALLEAPRKDGGFSALTLGWTLSGWAVADAARAAGFADHADRLAAFRDRLLQIAVGDRPAAGG